MGCFVTVAKAASLVGITSRELKAAINKGELKTVKGKMAFDWVVSQGTQVHWMSDARWVDAGKFATSSGISAGTDLALALIEQLFDRETAEQIARGAEYVWNDDPDNDPFARATASP